MANSILSLHLLKDLLNIFLAIFSWVNKIILNRAREKRLRLFLWYKTYNKTRMMKQQVNRVQVEWAKNALSAKFEESKLSNGLVSIYSIYILKLSCWFNCVRPPGSRTITHTMITPPTYTPKMWFPIESFSHFS